MRIRGVIDETREDEHAKRGEPAAAAIAFAIITVVALALRLWGIHFGGSTPRGRPDEEIFLGPALRMFGGSLNPAFEGRDFPDGYFLLLHALLRLYARWLSWRHGQEINLGCLFAVNPTSVLVVGRYLSAVAGTLTLVPTALIARRLVSPSRRTQGALVAALLLAGNYLHGRDSHFGVTDIVLTLLLAGAAWAAVRVAEDGDAVAATIGALAVGLATAVKWTGVFGMPVILGALLVSPTLQQTWRWSTRLLLASGVVLLTTAAFLAFSPFVAWDVHNTWAGLVSHGLRYQADEARKYLQDPGAALGHGIHYHSLVTLPIACGWPALAAALVGVIVVWRRRTAAVSVCLLYLGFVYGAAVGPTRVLFVRYCIPALPVLTALAAAGLVEGTAEATRRVPSRHARLAAVTAVAIAVAAPTAVRLARCDALLARSDTRELAAHWIREHARRATVLPQIAYSCVYALPADGIAACNAVLPSALRADVVAMPSLGENWTRAIDAGRAGWGTIAEYALASYWNAPGLVPRDADYVARGQPLLACGKPSFIRGFDPLDAACFDEVARFSPGRPGCAAVYDLFDQFYLPYAGFDGIERPGPEVVVYRNRCGPLPGRRPRA